MNKNQITISQNCINLSCKASFDINEMLHTCKKCNNKLEYVLTGTYVGSDKSVNNQWKNFDLLPLKNSKNIVSLNEGGSELILLDEISEYLGGAKFYLMMDMEQNPTGTFKDREASLIISRCKELGLDNLVFYSTGNTGRAYTHYAAQLGLTTYCFIPKQCHYKNTDFIKKNSNNYFIHVSDGYPSIAPYAKEFARVNNLVSIAPMHDRTEAYATVAYEQFEKIPNCTYFIQTIASGMGPIGYLRGHLNLIKFGLEEKEKLPRIVCIQSSEMNAMSKAFNNGKKELKTEDLSSNFPAKLFEPTLNSTNPVNNYPDLYNCLKLSNGIITDVTQSYVEEKSVILLESLKKRGICPRTDKENSLLIEFAGMIQLAEKNQFNSSDVIVMLACGRGRDTSDKLFAPDAIIDPRTENPIDLFKKLQKSV